MMPRRWSAGRLARQCHQAGAPLTVQHQQGPVQRRGVHLALAACVHQRQRVPQLARPRDQGLRGPQRAGPLALRRTRSAGGREARVTVVGAMSDPLGGARLAVHATVEPGAALRVDSAAATVSLPGRSGGTGPLRRTSDGR